MTIHPTPFPSHAAGDHKGMPYRSLEAIRNGLDERLKVVRTAKAWMAGDGRTLILGGPYGIGKSTVACWTALHWGTRDGSVSLPIGYATGADIGMVAPWEVAKMRCWTCEFAVLDDVEGVGDRRQQVKVEQILVHRHDQGLWTVMTTNLREHKFTSFVGERVVDRLWLDGAYQWVDGESLRRKRVDGESLR